MNFPFPCLALFLIFGLVLAYKRNQSTRKQEEATENFLDRENRANATRRKDVSTLPYISIPAALYTDVPQPASVESDFSAALDGLRRLSSEKILNLSGESNTDLKMKYGPQNLEFLSKCDDNFADLEGFLVTIGKTYLEEDQFSTALPYLEFLLPYHCDNSQIYLLTAQCYRGLGQNARVQELIDLVEKENFLLKDTVLHKLVAYL